MLVLSTIHQQLVSLPEQRGVPHSHPGNVSVVIHQTPLSLLQVQLQNMVVNLVGETVKATEGVDLIVADVRHGRVDEAGRPLADGGDDFGFVVAARASALFRRTGRHGVGIVRGRRAWGQGESRVVGYRAGRRRQGR